MPSASILINGNPGFEGNAPINEVVGLSNADDAGVSSWLWELLDQPDGPADELVDATSAEATLTPRKTGSYLIRLTINDGLASEAATTAIVAVLEDTGDRIPAAGETFEADPARGWAPAVNALLQRSLQTAADANVFLAMNTSAGLGQIVHVTGIATVRAGLPGEQYVPQVDDLTNFEEAAGTEPLGIVVGTPSGVAVAPSALCLVRRYGLVELEEAGAPAVGDPVWLGDDGYPTIEEQTDPTSVVRRLGHVVSAAGGIWRWFIDGSAGGGLASGDDGESAASSAGEAELGDGSDGDVTITGTTTLTRAMYYQNLTINSGARLATNGWPVHIRGTLTWVDATGRISCNGGDAVGQTGGTRAIPTNTYFTMSNPAAGGGGSASSAGAPSAGGDSGSQPPRGFVAGTTAAPAGTYANGLNGVGIGQGGSGGTSSASSAQSGAVTTTVAAINGDIRTFRLAIDGRTRAGAQWGAGSGGGGGRGGSGPGGGGGAGGGYCVVLVGTVVGDGVVEARGGHGGNGVGGAGGGGGGGGIVVVGIRTGTQAVSVAGGNGGLGTSDGVNKCGDGGNGAPGLSFVFRL